MGVKYSYDDYTTRGHGVIEGSWGNKDYEDKELSVQKVGNLPPNVKVSQSSKNYFSLKIPGRSKNGPIMKEIKSKVDNGQTIKINDSMYIRRNATKEYELIKKSKAKKQKASQSTKINQRDTVDDTYNHLMKIHRAANEK